MVEIAAFDRFDEAGEIFEKGQVEKGGGGGGNKEKKKKRQGVNTLIAKREEMISNSQENAQMLLEEHPESTEMQNIQIEAVLVRVMKRDANEKEGLRNLYNYAVWIRAEMRRLATPLPDRPDRIMGKFKITPYIGSGPGGQNRNKVATAIRMEHKLTGIEVCSENGTTQKDNKINTKISMGKLINEHLDDKWWALVGREKGDKPLSDEELMEGIYLMLETEVGASKYPFIDQRDSRREDMKRIRRLFIKEDSEI